MPMRVRPQHRALISASSSYHWRIADGTINVQDDVSRCFTCHKSEAQRDYVFTLERMQDAR